MGLSAYRSEIDGLRALSVLVILLFHLQVTRFGGGFIGVDVFFVISGFLITNIILKELEGGQFSFRQFYARRIARIIPALVVTIGLSLLAAMVLFIPQALEHAMQQGLAALYSVSNIFFWMEKDYWSPDAKSFLLLHTWSLGVEEQFYLFYPLLLFLCHRLFGVRGVWLLMLVLVAGGTIAAEQVVWRDRSAAFYMAPFRLNEFALGGLGGLLMPRVAQLQGRLTVLTSAGTAAGLGLIFYSAVTYSFFTPFPGYHALAPTLGLMLLVGDLLK